MSTATDLNDSEQVLTMTDTTTGTAVAEPHLSSLAVPTVKLDITNNWTGLDELPFDPIAERTLSIAADDERGEHQHGAFSVTFGRPTLIEGKGWACLFRLSAMGRVHISPARGTDAVDALQAAFTMVHKQLTGMSRRHRITFNGTDDLGFAPAGADKAPKAAGCPVMNGSITA